MCKLNSLPETPPIPYRQPSDRQTVRVPVQCQGTGSNAVPILPQSVEFNSIGADY